MKECQECPDFDLCLEQVILQIEEIEEIGEDYLSPTPRETRKAKRKDKAPRAENNTDS
ncbi:MAG: hypothetical protein QW231_00345 [Candidatus Bathyarchaeia archaeon]